MTPTASLSRIPRASRQTVRQLRQQYRDLGRRLCELEAELDPPDERAEQLQLAAALVDGIRSPRVRRHAIGHLFELAVAFACQVDVATPEQLTAHRRRMADWIRDQGA
jgi:hypothetical protein